MILVWLLMILIYKSSQRRENDCKAITRASTSSSYTILLVLDESFIHTIETRVEKVWCLSREGRKQIQDTYSFGVKDLVI